MKFLFCITNISLFIGARSDVNQDEWYWNNNTQINNSMFPESNSSLCQQMTWPLTYNDGINLRPKHCKKSLSYYVCQVDFNIKVTPIECNGTMLKVSWKQINIDQITNNTENMKIQIKINEVDYKTLSFSDQTYIISGLNQNTEYNVTAILIESDDTLLSTFVSATTFIEDLDPIINATTSTNSVETTKCSIKWKYKTEQFNSTSYYKIYSLGEHHRVINVSTASVNIIDDFYLVYEYDLSGIAQNTEIKFKIQAFACERGSDVTNVTGYCTVYMETPQPPQSNLIVPVIASAIALIVVCVIIGSFLFVKKKKKSTTSKTKKQKLRKSQTKHKGDVLNVIYENQNSKNEVTSKESDYATPVRLKNNQEFQNLKHFYIKESLNEFKALKKTFSKICSESLKKEGSHQVASNPDNSKKNRYKNIYPYDQALVLLENEKYINASYIEGFKSKRSYIATQGPKHQTLNDFWEMVWMEKSSIIVMLCNCVEKGKTKCEIYWPTYGNKNNYDYLEVECIEETNFGGIIKRSFVMKANQSLRNITQFHYVSWPDHDIPLTTSGMYRLRNLVNNEFAKNQLKGRIITHCSAGAGRTGTYIAIDNLIEEFHETGKVDVYNAVMKMRRNRKDMVQNKNQYIFVYKVLLENIMFPNTETSTDELSKLLSTQNWNSHVRNEFDKLSSLTPPEVNESSESIYQNFSPRVLSNDVNQIKLMNKNNGAIYMDAHYVKDERYSVKFIASSEPQIGQPEQFLKMIAEENSQFVVCLENLNSDPIFSKLQKQGNKARIGNHNVYVQKVTNYNEFVVMELELEDTENIISFRFSFLYFESWNETLSPPDISIVCDAINKVNNPMEESSFSSTLVYCRDGRSRTGLFLTLANLIEQIKSTDTVDVFRTVKDLREMRPGSLASLDLYKLCYQMINNYISKYLS